VSIGFAVAQETSLLMPKERMLDRLLLTKQLRSRGLPVVFGLIGGYITYDPGGLAT
jgi:hypothetical protein